VLREVALRGLEPLQVAQAEGGAVDRRGPEHELAVRREESEGLAELVDRLVQPALAAEQQAELDLRPPQPLLVVGLAVQEERPAEKLLGLAVAALAQAERGLEDGDLAEGRGVVRRAVGEPPAEGGEGAVGGRQVADDAQGVGPVRLGAQGEGEAPAFRRSAAAGGAPRAPARRAGRRAPARCAPARGSRGAGTRRRRGCEALRGRGDPTARPATAPSSAAWPASSCPPSATAASPAKPSPR